MVNYSNGFYFVAKKTKIVCVHKLTKPDLLLFKSLSALESALANFEWK